MQPRRRMLSLSHHLLPSERGYEMEIGRLSTSLISVLQIVLVFLAVHKFRVKIIIGSLTPSVPISAR